MGVLSYPGDSLAADEEELQPEPGERQRQQHRGEREQEPGRKVDHVSVLREESTRERQKITIVRVKLPNFHLRSSILLLLLKHLFCFQ